METGSHEGICTAWGYLKGWYRQATGNPIDPIQESILQISTEYEELVTQKNIDIPNLYLSPISSFSFNYEIPEIEEIIEASKK